MRPAAGLRSATGRELEIRYGDSVARVGQVAAVLREFSVEGVHFTETWDSTGVAPMGCGMVMAPWPNRVENGRWMLEGRRQQLDITDPGLGHATHGLLRNTAYEVLEHGSRSVTLGASVYPQHGYPFTLDTQVTYTLGHDGLTVTHRLVNAGRESAPCGVGSHPYLRVGDHPVDTLRVTVTGDRFAPVDGRQIPTSVVPVAGTPQDLRGGTLVADLPESVCLSGFSGSDGVVEHHLEAPDGCGVVLWADADFRWVQVYAPRSFPMAGGVDSRPAIAIEPMTCAVNAFNNGHDLKWLDPGETWLISWGLRPVGRPGVPGSQRPSGQHCSRSARTSPEERP